MNTWHLILSISTLISMNDTMWINPWICRACPINSIHIIIIIGQCHLLRFLILWRHTTCLTHKYSLKYLNSLVLDFKANRGNNRVNTDREELFSLWTSIWDHLNLSSKTMCFNNNQDNKSVTSVICLLFGVLSMQNLMTSISNLFKKKTLSLSNQKTISSSLNRMSPTSHPSMIYLVNANKSFTRFLSTTFKTLKPNLLISLLLTHSLRNSNILNRLKPQWQPISRRDRIRNC